MTEDIEQTIELVQVKTIHTEGKSVLVQTEDFRRYFVPSTKVKDGHIDKAELDKAALYGINWEAYLSVEDITVERLSEMLRRSGLYTLADLEQRDRRLIRIGTKLIGQVVRDAAKRADEAKPPRRKK